MARAPYLIWLHLSGEARLTPPHGSPIKHLTASPRRRLPTPPGCAGGRTTEDWCSSPGRPGKAKYVQQVKRKPSQFAVKLKTVKQKVKPEWPWHLDCKGPSRCRNQEGARPGTTWRSRRTRSRRSTGPSCTCRTHRWGDTLGPGTSGWRCIPCMAAWNRHSGRSQSPLISGHPAGRGEKQGQAMSHYVAIVIQTTPNIYAPAGKLLASKVVCKIQITGFMSTWKCLQQMRKYVSIQWNKFTNILAMFYIYFQMSTGLKMVNSRHFNKWTPHTSRRSGHAASLPSKGFFSHTASEDPADSQWQALGNSKLYGLNTGSLVAWKWDGPELRSCLCHICL